jgi:hypothetical protein
MRGRASGLAPAIRQHDVISLTGAIDDTAGRSVAANEADALARVQEQIFSSESYFTASRHHP